MKVQHKPSFGCRVLNPHELLFPTVHGLICSKQGLTMKECLQGIFLVNFELLLTKFPWMHFSAFSVDRILCW